MYREDAAPRIFFDEPVELALPGQDCAIPGQALNISPNGMFIRASVLLPAGTAVQVRCELAPGEPLAAAATVVRAVVGDGLEPAGMGLRFDQLEELSAWRLATFLDRRLHPARGVPVRLQLPEVPALRATAHASWQNLISVDAPLPFLRVGSEVALEAPAPLQTGRGQIRWVEVHVCPQTGVPRLNIGIELPPADQLAAIDEDCDPIYTEEYAAVARALREQSLERRRARSC